MTWIDRYRMPNHSSCSKTDCARPCCRPPAPSWTRRWPIWAGPTCCPTCPIWRYRWCSGCSAKQVRTPRFSTTWCCRPPAASSVATPALPYAGGGWVVWDRDTTAPTNSTLGGLPLRRVDDGEPAAAGRCPPGTGLVAGRFGQGDAGPGPPACAGPGPVRQADRVVPGGPAPAGRDAGGHRRRRGDAEPARRRTTPI